MANAGVLGDELRTVITITSDCLGETVTESVSVLGLVPCEVTTDPP
jgi:hypothetical protein